MSIKVTLDQSKEWDLQVSELTQLADDAPTPDDFGDVQIQMICQRAAEWGFAQAAQPSQVGELSSVELAHLADAHFYKGMQPTLAHYVAFAKQVIAAINAKGAK